jgi:integral membrane protein (TIGR00529 family)
MVVLAKIGLVVALLLVLIRLKWDLGLVLFLNTCLTAVLFAMKPAAFGRAVLAGATSWETLELAGIIVLVLYLGEFLQTSGAFKAMVDALKNLVRDDRLILAIPSAFIGLLPMMAGAMMGAPIVDEAARRWNVPPAWKTFFNYWFRHVWEYWWPLYINIIMASAIFRVPVWKISLYQAPFSLVAIGAGLVALYRKLPRLPRERDNRGSWQDVGLVVFSIWPIILTIVLIFAFRLNMLVALAVAAVLTQVTARLDLAGRWGVVVRGFSPKIVLLIVALMVFKKVLEGPGRCRPGRPAPRPVRVRPDVRGAVRRRPPDRRQPGLRGHLFPAPRPRHRDRDARHGPPDLRICQRLRRDPPLAGPSLPGPDGGLLQGRDEGRLPDPHLARGRGLRGGPPRALGFPRLLGI